MTFDRPLKADTGLKLNWHGGTGPPLNKVLTPQVPPSINADGTVTFPGKVAGVDFGPPRISYDASPALVMSRFLLKAAPFVDYPLTPIA